MKTKTEKSEKEILEEISIKLDKIIFTMAIQGKNGDTQIKILKRNGWKEEDNRNFLGINGRVRDRKGWKEE
jgi:hypothetical protein